MPDNTRYVEKSHGSGHKAWAVEEISWITPENLSAKDQMERGNTKEIFSTILNFSLGLGLYHLMISSTFIPTESNSTPVGGGMLLFKASLLKHSVHPTFNVTSFDHHQSI